jgi:hypothetical protein
LYQQDLKLRLRQILHLLSAPGLKALLPNS